MLKQTFFIHGGPGSHAAVERKWFGASLSVHWWDQPSVSASPDPFQALIDATQAEFERLLKETGCARLPILTHSSGALIGRALADRIPKAISSLTFLSANEFTPRAFVNLAQHILKNAELGEARPALQSAFQAVRSGISAKNFWPLINAIVAVPGFPTHYWGPESAPQMEKYLQLAKECPPLDMATYSAVMNSILARPVPRPSAYSGPVRLVLGTNDSLIQVEEEAKAWGNQFPDLKLQLCAGSGHWVHFEQPPASWLPAE